MTRSEITRRRLRSQRIEVPEGSTAGGGGIAAVVSHLGAVQAQDYPAAKWAVALRTPGARDGAATDAPATDAAVERAISDREIVRTWPMRGTLHFVAAADARWITELLAPRVVAGTAARQRQLGLDAAQVARAEDVFADALRGGGRLTREGMYDALARGGVDPDGQRGYHLLSRAAMDGVICFGPHDGKQPTFVLLDEWVPGAPRLEDRDAALAALARRYFTGHGPATLADFCWWSGLTATDAKRGVEAAGADLAAATDDAARACWMSPAVADAADAAAPEGGDGVHLLPAYDEYLLGYRDRSAALDPGHAAKIVPGGNGVFAPILVVRGRVVGTWKRQAATRTRPATAAVTPYPFEPLAPADAFAVDEAARRYAAFLGGGSSPPT